MRPLPFLALIVVAVACPKPATDLCNDDADCGDAVCLGGRCQPIDKEGEGEAVGEGEGEDVGEGEGEDVGEGEGEGEGEKVGEGEGEGEPVGEGEGEGDVGEGEGEGEGEPRPPVCSNGRIEGREECDDGDLVDGDGCSAACTIECVFPTAASAVRTASGCLAFFDETVVWSEASARCAAVGGHLAVPQDADELVVADALVQAQPWIGVHDQFVEGDDVTVTGEPVAASEYAAGEPNDQGGEDCVRLSFGGWNDLDCARDATFLCEVPVHRSCAPTCDDGLACNGTEVCIDGACSAGVPQCRADGALCFEEEPGETSCGNCNAAADCDDRDFCTGTELCIESTCTEPADEPCTAASCPASGCGSAAFCGASGSCVTSAWITGEPNDFLGIQDCMHIHLDTGVGEVGWDDESCLLRNAFACSERVPGARPYGDFFVVANPVPFAEAEALCDGVNGTLVADRTLGRHADLVDAFYDVGPLWIGGLRVPETTTFAWRDDGSTVPAP